MTMKFKMLTKKNQRIVLESAKDYFDDMIDQYYGILESHKSTKERVKECFTDDNIIMNFDWLQFIYNPNCSAIYARDMGYDVAAHVLYKYYDIAS